MTDAGQTGLDDFAAPDEDRPDEEAAVVAGNGGDDATVIDPTRESLPEASGAVELAVTQVDYTIEGSGADETPLIHVFGRDGDATAEHVVVRGFRPYFYAPTDTIDRGDLQDDRITDWEEGYESIRGEELTKIYGRTPRDVGQIRDEFDHYEADILFPNRFLIDKDVSGGVRVPERRMEDGRLLVDHEEVEAVEPMDVPPRVNTFDIEVDDRNGFPEEGEEPIICLTSHDSYDDEYVVWLYESPGGNGSEVVSGDLPDYDPLRDDASYEVRSFETEAAMLDAFLTYIETTDPDVLTGWNFEEFDAPYFLDRLEELDPAAEEDLSIERLSRVSEVWRSNWGAPDVKGRVVFDLLYAYKRTQFTELESYRLDAVGEMELGVGKERYPGDIGDLWEDDPERLLEYNLRDVELCVELDRKQEVIAFWREVANFVGCKLEDAPTPGDAVDMYVLHEAHDRFALPSKGQQEAGEEYEGGAVFEPISGVKEMVTVLDLKCFSGDTDVLTPDGVRNISSLEVDDQVYTLDPDTFECEVKPVVDTCAYDNNYGELHYLSGNTHDFKVTENHRFLVSKERGWDEQEPDDFEFMEYRDIPAAERFAFPQHQPMDGKSPDTFDLVSEVEGGHVVVYTESDLRRFRNQVPDDVTEELDLLHGSSSTAGLTQKVGKYLIPVSTFRNHRPVIEEHADQVFLKYGRSHGEIPLSFDMENWLELLGWFVTEGSTDSKRGRLTLHQSDDDGRNRIESLLEEMGIDYSVDERGFNVSNRFLVDWLDENGGNGFADKRLPEWVFDLDAELLEVLLETMIRGDGSRTDSGLRKFWTKSDDLKEAIIDIGVRCGHKPTVSEQSDGTWYVSLGKRGSFEKRTNATTEDHDGEVYCVTAEDNHVILAGRNGNFQWVGQSLYPMCMVTINASPETKVDPDTYDGETFVSPNGTHFRTEPDGIIRDMVTELLDEREEKKALRNEHDPETPEYETYDRQQAAVKVIMNSLYGVSGWEQFRLYDQENAAAVTATGRGVIEYTETVTNEMGYEVAYGDTDSVMIELGSDKSKDEAIDASFDLEERINASYDEYAREELDAEDHRFQIEFEKLYRRFFQAGKKKRYAGHIVWKEGKDVDDVDITGFEYKRSDIAPITKEVQHRVLEMIVKEGDIEAVKDYVNEVIADFQAGNVDPEDVGIPGGIGKKLENYDTDTAQVRGAKYANLLLGTNFASGSKPKRIYVEKVHPSFWKRMEEERGLDPQEDPLYGEFKRDPDVICFEYADQLPDEFAVDWDKMLEKTLKGPIARILEALDVSWEEVKSGQEQTGLGQYM